MRDSIFYICKVTAGMEGEMRIDPAPAIKLPYLPCTDLHSLYAAVLCVLLLAADRQNDPLRYMHEGMCPHIIHKTIKPERTGDGSGTGKQSCLIQCPE